MTAPKGWRSAQWLTTTEAAAVVGVSRSRFYEMTHAGDVPLVRDDHGRQRIRPADLQAWMSREGLGETDAEALDLFTAAQDDPEPTQAGQEPTRDLRQAMTDARADLETGWQTPEPTQEEPEPAWDPEVARRGLAECRAALASTRRPA